MTAIDLSGNPNPFTVRLLEDLSAVGNTIDNPPPIPEPEIYALFILKNSVRARQCQVASGRLWFWSHIEESPNG